MQIDCEDVHEGMTLEQARQATSINIDDSGTWCNWSIDEKEIEWTTHTPSWPRGFNFCLNLISNLGYHPLPESPQAEAVW